MHEVQLIPPDFEPILYQILQEDLTNEDQEDIALLFQLHPDIAKKLKPLN